jgi:hypothetical protein
MAGRPDTAAILAALQATRANARERQDELERKIREEARSLRQGAAAGAAADRMAAPRRLLLAPAQPSIAEAACRMCSRKLPLQGGKRLACTATGRCAAALQMGC